MKLQVDREKNLEKTLEAAATLRRADLILKRPTDLAANGFVFSIAEIDEYIRRKDALDAAHRTVAMVCGHRMAA
jgi:hypothetical protein